MYVEREREKFKNKVIQREDFNEKESQLYYVSVLMNHHQDLENLISINVITLTFFYIKFFSLDYLVF